MSRSAAGVQPLAVEAARSALGRGPWDEPSPAPPGPGDPAPEAPDPAAPEALRELERRLGALSPPGPDEPAMAPLVGALRDAGLLAACGAGGDGHALSHHPARPEALLEALAAVGAASLSAGRLFEGHVNAVKLVLLMARGAARDRWLGDVARGALFGVWGAEGPDPVRFDGVRLHGQKLFASGADVVDRAIVTARDGAGIRLVVLEADALGNRLHPGEWSMSGMRATASGRCDLGGLAVEEDQLLGGPDDYFAEPHFRGGVWRYAAVQLGAMRGMTRAAADQLRARGQIEAPLQSARLRRMVSSVETARLWLSMAACEVERPDAPPEAASTAMLARLRTAEEAVALMAAMDEALGVASFATSHPVERPRRDLQVYLRQADPDGLGADAMRALLAEPGRAARWSLA